MQQKAAEIATGAKQTGKNEDEDTLIQVLGPDNPGRMRAMGRNVSKTKLACFNVNHKSISEMQEKQIQLMQKVNELQSELAKVKNQVSYILKNRLRHISG